MSVEPDNCETLQGLVQTPKPRRPARVYLGRGCFGEGEVLFRSKVQGRMSAQNRPETDGAGPWAAVPSAAFCKRPNYRRGGSVQSAGLGPPPAPQPAEPVTRSPVPGRAPSHETCPPRGRSGADGTGSRPLPAAPPRPGTCISGDPGPAEPTPRRGGPRHPLPWTFERRQGATARREEPLTSR